MNLGVIGLGRGFMLTLPSLLSHPQISLRAATSSRTDARQDFSNQFNAPSYKTYNELLDNDLIDMVYVATPHEQHADHTVAALRAGKHVLLEKPISISMEDADRIVEAEQGSNKTVIIGPSHSFDPAIQIAFKMISDGDFGSVKMIHSAYYTDFMYRPRRPEELDLQTGGVLFSQGAHQFDIARFLAGGEAQSIIGTSFIYDPKRRASGAYTCQIRFSNNATASLVYSGYDHFLSDMDIGGISELGSKVTKISGAARSKIRDLTPEEEMSLKKDRGYNAAQKLAVTDSNEHFGRWVVSLEKADMIIEPEHIDLYTDNGKSRIDIPVQVSTRQNVCQSMVDLVVLGIKPVQTASWGRATLECCQALLESNKTGTALKLRKQVSTKKITKKNDNRTLS